MNRKSIVLGGVRIRGDRIRAVWLMLSAAFAALGPGAIGSIAAEGPGDVMLQRYFEQETRRLSGGALQGIDDLEEWRVQREERRTHLLEMLSLSPMPEKTPLKPEVTGRIEREDFVVENLHFQSMPNVYVTANLYRPKEVDEPLPTVLYVCGHARRVKDGVSYGNKTAYHHHGAWFARHGYVCLVIDTIHRGEIRGIHHGTYRYGMWWWNARGYSSAGIETWNSIRALDYLETRSEVDPERFGVTGRSGGGAYSWWLAAVDERVKVAAPVAGITDLRNHVLDGTVEGHCDCMFPVNTYRWDFSEIAAMVAPRPLLICNSDRDGIFPLDGVVRVHRQVRRVYDLYDEEERLGLVITPGPHQDTQELRIPVFQWFNRYLKDKDALIETPARDFFEPEELKVFEELPDDERNTSIQESFVPKAGPFEPPETEEKLAQQKAKWLKALRKKSFRGWPVRGAALDMERVGGAEHEEGRIDVYEFTSQRPFRLRVYLLTPKEGERRGDGNLIVQAVDKSAWPSWARRIHGAFGSTLPEGEFPEFAGFEGDAESGQGGGSPFDGWAERYAKARAVALVVPRGIGYSAWQADERVQTHVRRRFMLLGQTLDGMRVWDMYRAIKALKRVDGVATTSWVLHGRGATGVNLLYASLFADEPIRRIRIDHPPSSHHDGPYYLNILRFMDLAQGVTLAVSSTQVELHGASPDAWAYCRQTAENLGWPEGRLRVVSD